MLFCARYGCNYPVQDILRSILSARVRFELVQDESEAVKQLWRCAAGTVVDVAPFKAHDVLSWCPECDTPFHMQSRGRRPPGRSRGGGHGRRSG